MLYMNTLILVAVLYHNNHMIAQEEYCYTVNTLSCLSHTVYGVCNVS